ncbi:MAG: SDR family NAD(P)-dependent oxidoreductase [Salinarimonas sp.]|nr:SDR family NAD(P)-dependent oxidoreductase [Salinarimonas sp.]
MPLDAIAGFRFETTLAGTHPILRDHHVHGRPLVPGVTWLDLIWQALTEYGFDGEGLVLENIVFPQALSVAPDGVAQIALAYDEATRLFTISSDGGTRLHCRCRLADDQSSPAPAVPEVPPLGTMVARQLTEVYAGARALSIAHGPWMAGEGTAFLGDDIVVADIALSDEAASSARSHALHPALMDCATVVPFAAGGFGLNHDNPAIPLAIRRFHALRRGFADARVVCRLSQSAQSNDDILHNDLWLLDARGRSLCVIEALSAKRIRAADTLAPPAPAPAASKTINEDRAVGLHDEIVAFIIANTPCESIPDPQTGFFDLGLGSADLLGLAARLDEMVAPSIYPTLLYEYPSPDALIRWLDAQGVTGLATSAASALSEPPRPSALVAAPASSDAWQDFVALQICEAAGLESIDDPDIPFFDLGLDSATLLALATTFETSLGHSFFPTLCYEHGSVAALARHFRESGLALPVSGAGGRSPAPVTTPQFPAPQVMAAQVMAAQVMAAQVEAPQVAEAAPVSDTAHCRHDLSVWWQPHTLPKEAPELRGWYRRDAHSAFAQLPIWDRETAVDGLVWQIATRDAQATLAETLTLSRRLITAARPNPGRPLRLMVICPDPVIAHALTAFLRTLARETPRISGRIFIGVEVGPEILPTHSQGFDLLRAAPAHEGGFIRQCQGLNRAQSESHLPSMARAGAILVSGGHGAIALHLVEALVDSGATRFALLARRPATGAIAGRIDGLRARGIEIVSLITDLTDAAACARACKSARARFGSITGVIHCAGILRDGMIQSKNPEDAQAVLAAKYDGAAHLDALTRGDRLDFFSVCGSISGLAGNLGQSDYAFANGAVAGLMARRARRVARGDGYGRSLCFHWPLWAEGAMVPPEERLRQLDRETGLGALPTGIATRAFLEAITATGDETDVTPLWLDPSATDRLSAHLTTSGLAPGAGIAVRPERPATSAYPEPRPASAAEPIAVVGLAGEYPGARDLAAFWDNLMAGRDCITPVPKERWDADALPDADAIYAREGGFIADHDRFDAAFFAIPPREAAVLDPQERRFLQIAWQAIEAAGHNPRRLAGSDTGVFVGTMWGQYQLHATTEPGASAASIFAAIANRVSYTLDLAGPSFAVDSMCSSALSAIHLAVASLRKGECGMAIAGGVNLMSHPQKYRFLCQNRMLAADGRCRSFGAGGDGYVPGEGVGAVILKPLAQAQADGDPILAVITGSAINHGGRGAGMTVPNPAAQAKVITAAHAEAGATAPVSYIEAHGTGTSLGDPIEIDGLRKALGESAAVPCAIGSVKSNIGHLEGAAGIAALSKVVLQIRHGMLAPSLHAQEPNPKLAIEDGPFRIQTQAAAWKRVAAQGSQAEHSDPDCAPKRVAGISAFGAGGANAHLVVEEPPPRAHSSRNDAQPRLLVISARDDAGLARYVDAWIGFLDGPQHDPFALIAATSIVARESWPQRLAVIAADAGEALSLLRRWRADRGEAGTLLCDDDALPEALRNEAEGYLAGADFTTVADLPASRVPIPVYPFAGERHWLPVAGVTETAATSATAIACPLLQHLQPTMPGIVAYDSILDESEPLLGMHRIADESLMPAAMMLACIVTAVARHLPDQPLQIRDARIGQPFRAGQSELLRTELFAHGDTHVVELRAGPDGPLVMQAVLDTQAAKPAPSPQDLPAGPGEACLEIYDAFATRGLVYGTPFRRLLERRQAGSDIVAALRPSQDEGWRGAILCMDAAMQAVALADDAITEDVTVWLPDSFSGIVWHADPGAATFARVKSTGSDTRTRSYAITLLDDDGQVLWQVERFTLKARGGAAAQAAGAVEAVLPEAAPEAPSASADAVDDDDLRQAVRSMLCTMLATESGLAAQDIRRGNGFVALGVDSVMVMNMTARLEEKLGTLPKSLFFEHPGIREMTDWMIAGYAPALRKMLLSDETPEAGANAAAASRREPARSAPTSDAEQPLRSVRPGRGSAASALRGIASNRVAAARAGEAEPLAVIGLAGRFPQAEDIDILWRNLADGLDAVGPVPRDRWPAGMDGSIDQAGVWHPFRGGFLDDVAGFDADFFNMTPAEAERADPAERLMLETAWSCAEHAGYSRKGLSGKPVGVFVASMWQHYQHFGVDEALEGRRKTTKSMLSATASRISGMLGLTGPCIALETMCSGALTGLHLARRAIAAGDCEAAFVGGVNLSLHPLKYRTLNEDGYLSANGRCAAFGAQADGYVPCEAVAGILVKPLSRAIAEGDPVHGVILGSAANHNGAANGSTAPSASAQTAVIQQALAEAGIDAHRISYVEASGTCTRLGDPIELEGLENALSAAGRHPGCSIGSIKSNLGHAEAAAGLAGLIKVLLQLRHEKLAPTLHADSLNPALGLAEKPFKLVDSLSDWLPGAQKFAAVSAFGAGGSNAHAILTSAPALQPQAAEDAPRLVPVSARSRSALDAQLRVLAGWLGENADADPAAIAATLALGREDQPCRIAFVCRSTAALRASIEAYLAGGSDSPGICLPIEAAHGELNFLFDDTDGRTLISGLIEQRKLGKLGQLWSSGVNVDWRLLFAPGQQRLSLPGSVFDRRPYLVDHGLSRHAGSITNLSDLHRQIYRVRLAGGHPAIVDHVIGEARQVSLALMLRLAEAVLDRADPLDDSHASREVTLDVTRPWLLEGDLDCEVEVTPEGNTLALTISVEGIVHGQARAYLRSPHQPGIADESASEEHDGANAQTISGDRLYADFAADRYHYGSRYRAITSLSYRERTAVAQLQALAGDDPWSPESMQAGIIDAGLQAALPLLPQDPAQQWFPVRIGVSPPYGKNPAHILRAALDLRRQGNAHLTLRWLDAEGALVRSAQADLAAQRIAPMRDQALILTRTAISLSANQVVPPETEGHSYPAVICIGDMPDASTQGASADSGFRLIARTGDTEAACAALPSAATHLAICIGAQAAAGTSLQNLWQLVYRAREAGIAALDLLIHADADTPHLAGLRAWFAALTDEIPRYRGRISVSHTPLTLTELLATRLRRAILASRSGDGNWHEPGSRPRNQADTDTEPFSAKGDVVVITGGAGGLGRVFARHLAERHGAHVVLVGRSRADEAVGRFVAQLRDTGSDAVYYRADMTDPQALRRLRRLIGMRYGRIDGAIHAAGITEDAWIVEQNADSLARVLAPKVAGTLALTDLLGAFSPRWVAGFGSVSGYLGNAGQSDYSYANAYMDAALSAGLGDCCKVVHLSWPLWRNLGMQPAPAMVAAMDQRYGLQPMPAATGIALFDELMAGPSGSHLVSFGDPQRIQSWLAGREAGIAPPDPAAAPAARNPAKVATDTAPKIEHIAANPSDRSKDDAKRISREWVAQALAEEIRLAPEQLDWRRPIDQFGLSSIDATGLAARLSAACGTALPATLLYAFRDFAALATDLERHAPQQREADDPPAQSTPAQATAAQTSVAKGMRSGTHRGYRFGSTRPDLAIIGTACRMPGAEDMTQFWSLLAEGRDAVQPIPQRRWDWRAFAAETDTEAMKGGFLEGIEHFDYPFFGISHREACAMDPQERIVLQTAWHALEDAGIVPSTLAGRPVGVYMGAMWNQYQLLARDHWREGTADTYANATLAAIANRLSFLLDLGGPSLTLDTMCSSSLMALKLACDALRQGEIELAIVGGVNVSVHPFKYHQLQQGLFLSPQGRCGAFADGGDGYVPAEGAGIVVLRRAPEAEAAGERIHALVRGIGVSHGGRANGFTVPRPQKQAEAIRAALADAAIAPGSVSYVEAHGTGTALGDPIEIDGLRRAYMEQGSFPLSIGSVKANIGHAEAAAGMASLAKVIGQFAHRSLAPAIHCEPLNPRLALEDSTISIPKTLTPWEPATSEQAILRAGISGFGAGGTNVHVILEEPPRTAEATLAARPASPRQSGRAIEIVTLSASGEAALRKLCLVLKQRIAEDTIGTLAAIAATSQLHREPLRHRIAFCVASRADLHDALETWLADAPCAAATFGRSDPQDEAAMVPAAYGDMPSAMALARQWVHGRAIDWHPLWPAGSPRTQLPLYPFRALPVWLDERPGLADIAGGTGAAAVAGRVEAKISASGPAHAPVARVSSPDVASPPDAVPLETHVREAIAAVIRIDSDDLDETMPFDRVGMDSITARDCAEALSRRFAVAMDATWFFNHPTVRQLSRALAEAGASRSGTDEPATNATAVEIAADTPPAGRDEPAAAGIDAADCAIAIIGASGAFAGAADLGQFWNNLAAGIDSVTEIAPQRWDIERYYDPRPGERGRTISRRMGQLDGIGAFDPVAYGLMPEEALAMDPKQRLFLKHAGLALDDAGIATDSVDGSDCGVFAGTMAGSYRTILAESGEASEALAMLGNHAAALPARVSYWLNLTGPTLAVDTACSSSLVAIHLACRAITSGECARALAGGVFVAPGPYEQVASSQAGMLSPEGRCKTFDDNADGIAIGEGVGVVVLKRLDRALADGDPIHAVIRASGINQDGRTNGITAPNALSQGRLIRHVLGEAGLSGDDLDYLECHGTGTRLGDPVEIEGLRLALADQRTQPLPIGSVKPNIGHCYAAAGMASLFKVILGLKHEAIAPNIGMHTPNALVDFAKAAVTVPTRPLPWQRGERTRRGAVSAFGYTGTNAHLVIEEAPARAVDTVAAPAGIPQLLVLSGRKPALVVEQARRLAAYIAETDPALDALAHTLQCGRKAESWRVALIVTRSADAADLLLALRADAIVRAGKATEADAFIANDVSRAESAALQAQALDWLAGRAVIWPDFVRDGGRRLSLPGRPLAEKVYWPKTPAAESALPHPEAPAPTPAGRDPSNEIAPPPALRRVSRAEFRSAA